MRVGILAIKISITIDSNIVVVLLDTLEIMLVRLFKVLIILFLNL